jgi:predicted regulator of Ras-like GTPase activity (Roadblock/LC7/MglB family)
MSPTTLLDEVKGIRGYRASGILAHTGELLVGDGTEGLDPGLVGATFNELLRSAHQLCRSIGLEGAREMILCSEKGTVVMLCTGRQEKVHLHLITVLSTDGNQALARLTMERLAPHAVRLLS